MVDVWDVGTGGVGRHKDAGLCAQRDLQQASHRTPGTVTVPEDMALVSEQPKFKSHPCPFLAVGLLGQWSCFFEPQFPLLQNENEKACLVDGLF